MKKKTLKRIGMLLLSVIMIYISTFYVDHNHKEIDAVSQKIESEDQVLVGGIPVGIYLETKGVLVVDTAEIKDEFGQSANPASKIVKSGDYIIAVNARPISTKRELSECIKNLDDKKVILNMRRKNEDIKVSLNAVQNKRGEYQLGIWVKDDTQGLGTLTFVTSKGQFASLGHGIHDYNSEEVMEISNGNLYDASILSVKKSEKGSPGGIEGMIIYSPSKLIGTVDKNSPNGIFGSIEMDKLEIENPKWCKVAPKNEVKTGHATIYCEVDKSVEKYDVIIEKINVWNRNGNKSFVVKVTDQELIRKTGGIVQGMSGSPIIQNGKLVGAITHVFVDDPTRGYGIFAETMLKDIS